LVFDRFSQVDAGSTRKYEGTGIGLALAKELIEMHGGTISVKSQFIDNYPDDHVQNSL
jgi:signal transduction histidine kinase